MKKNNKKQIPTFKSIQEERKFWDTHSVATYWDSLEPVEIKFPQPKHILVTLKPNQLTILKRIAIRRHSSSLRLIQKWITEKLQEEKLATSH